MGCGSSSSSAKDSAQPVLRSARPVEQKEGEEAGGGGGGDGGVHLIDYDDGSNPAAEGMAVPLGSFDLPDEDSAAVGHAHRTRPNFKVESGGEFEIEAMRGYFHDLAPGDAYAGSYTGGFFLVRNAADFFGPKRAHKGIGVRFPHGKGKIVFTAPAALLGFVYEGDWVDGLREGQGRFSDILGSHAIAGTWVRDVIQSPYRTWKWRDGEGLVEVTGEAERIAAAHAQREAHLLSEIRTIEYPDDSVYEGDCLERGHTLDANDRPIPHGQGVMTFWAGDSRLHYSGAWDHGVQGGAGALTYKDGRRFQGQWARGKEHGEGTMFDAQGHVVQHGVWVEGTMQSQMQLPASAPDEPPRAAAAASSSSSAVPGLVFPRQMHEDSTATPRLDAKALSPRDIDSMIDDLDVNAASIEHTQASNASAEGQ